VDIDMSLPAAQRVRQALVQGKRNIKQMMEITGASKHTCFVERGALLRRTGEKLPKRDSINDRIRACIAHGMTDAREIQEVSGATRRNHIHRLLKEARAKEAK
jgi:bacterioferritin-associated ferredoxin